MLVLQHHDGTTTVAHMFWPCQHFLRPSHTCVEKWWYIFHTSPTLGVFPLVITVSVKETGIALASLIR